MIRLTFAILNVLLLCVLPGCSLVQSFFAWLGPPEKVVAAAPMRDSALMRLAPEVRPILDRLLPTAEFALTQTHLTVDMIPARYKRRLAVTPLKQPWEGLIHLERQGLLLAELAEGRAVNLPVLLDVLEAGMDRTSAFHKPVAIPASLTIKDLVMFMLESLE